MNLVSTGKKGKRSRRLQWFSNFPPKKRWCFFVAKNKNNLTPLKVRLLESHLSNLVLQQWSLVSWNAKVHTPLYWGRRTHCSWMLESKWSLVFGTSRQRQELTFGALKLACPRKVVVVGNRQEWGTHNSIHMSCGPHMYIHTLILKNKIYTFTYTRFR